MVCLRRSAPWLVCAMLSITILPTAASEFPFGSELILDASPMHGSKRMPMLEIDDNGTASIDLWCASLRAQATIGGDTISIVPEPPAVPAQCTPERQSDDEKLLTTLTQATNWRRSGDVIELRGSTTLRFRLMTN